MLDEIIKRTAQNSMLKELRITGVSSTAEVQRELLDSIRTAPKIEYLRLSNLSCTQTMFEVLRQICSLDHIRELNLSSMNLLSSQLDEIMQELLKNKRNSFLESLNLANNALLEEKVVNDVDNFACACPGAVECDHCKKRREDREDRMRMRKKE